MLRISESGWIYKSKRLRLNSKNGCLKYILNYYKVWVNKGLFTNGSKEALNWI
jgi:hypothetical protein